MHPSSQYWHKILVKRGVGEENREAENVNIENRTESKTA